LCTKSSSLSKATKKLNSNPATESKEPQPSASSDDKNEDSDKNVDTGHQDKLQNKVREELADYFKNPSKEEAERHIVWVEVPVWRLKDGKKVSDIL